MSFLTKLRQVLSSIAEIAERLPPRHYPQGLPALCYSGLENHFPSQSTTPAASLSELLGPILYAVPRNRRSIERRLTRKGVIPDFQHTRPKKNIVFCLNCGHPHEIQTICGNCYEQVKQETKKLKESMDKEVFRYNYPQKEVTYVYEDDDKQHTAYDKRYVVEVEDKRPKWFPNSLLNRKAEKD